MNKILCFFLCIYYLESKSETARMLLLFLLCVESKSTPPVPTVVDGALNPNDFQLVWKDDFMGFALNTSLWNVQVGYSNGAYSWVNNVAVRNDLLYLKQENDTSVGSYSVGRLNSIPYFGYGFFESRIQFPNLSGFHDSFFLLGWQTFLPPAYNEEIDIVECNTYNMNYFNQHYHTWTNGVQPERQKQSTTHWKINQYTPPNISLTGWNTFGLYWNTTVMNVFFNGGRMLTTEYLPTIVNNPLNILFTQTLWKNNPPQFPPINATTYMVVDYVAYYRTAQDSVDTSSLCASYPSISCV